MGSSYNGSSKKNWNRLFPISCINSQQLPELKNYSTEKYIPSDADKVPFFKIDRFVDMGLDSKNRQSREEIIVFVIKNKHQAESFEKFINIIPQACVDELYIHPDFQYQLFSSFKKLVPNGEYHKFHFTIKY
jgi:hypothetical protein